MYQRIFDILFSFVGLLVLSPIFLIIAIMIKLDSQGSIFFRQERVGQHRRVFRIYKFRTMYTNNSGEILSLTIGNLDPRITRLGHILRKFKIDELPQLINVLLGDMSLVGPRPEVPEYIKYYNKDELKVFKIKPGITDLASITYINENELLGNSKNPEKVYIETIMREKLRQNIFYLGMNRVAENTLTTKRVL